jgi:hypothetical protein
MVDPGVKALKVSQMTDVAVTVNVAALLVVLPIAFETTQRQIAPLSESAVGGVV